MWADLVYQGLWVDPMRIHLEGVIDSMNKYVTGVVRLKVFKGGLRIVGRNSPFSLYSKELIDYNTGWYPSDEEARGFITVHGFYALTALKVRHQNSL
jgi:argininosuccinate synthase